MGVLGKLPAGEPAGETVVRQVARALRDAIVSMRLPPGEKLSEQALARQLGTSRQPVREALIRLAEIGLVRVLPQRGTLVEKLSAADVLDAHFIRDAIECALAREAAAHMDPVVLRRLRDSLADQRRAARAGDGDGFFAHDEAFHRLIAEASGRLSAWRVVEEVKPKLDRIRFFNMRRAQRRALVLRQHTAILRALAGADPAAAAAAMRAHLANVPNSLPGLVEQRPDLFGDAPVHATVIAERLSAGMEGVQQASRRAARPRRGDTT